MEPKVFQPGDPTVWIPVGRYSSTPGWCFLPWKGIAGAYRWGFKARTEISDYYSALIGMQKAFLADEKEIFEVTIKGQKKLQTQRRARWRDGDTRPSLLKPKQGWVEVRVEELESLSHQQLKEKLLESRDTATSSFGGKELFSERPIRSRNFQNQFSLDTFALWGGRCAITGSFLALEAAHLKPVAGCETDDPALTDPYNGILLTASLHRLMDAGVFGFDSKGILVVDPDLSDGERVIHQLAVARKIEFHAEAIKYLQHRIKRAKLRADS